MQEIIKKQQNEIFRFYQLCSDGTIRAQLAEPARFEPGSKELAQRLRRLLADCELECSEENFYALAQRVLDLNTTLFKAACERSGVPEEAVRPAVDAFVREFYEAHHAKTAQLLAQKLQLGHDVGQISAQFRVQLLQLVQEIGEQLDICAPVWLAKVEENNKFFRSLEEPFEYIKQHKLYYLDGQKRADRCYALAVDLGGECPRLVPYSEYFAQEFERINEAFERFFAAANGGEGDGEAAWRRYLRALQAAMMSTQASVEPWQIAEREWMGVKDSWQIGHFLEYYEDAFTHAVALEWDLRIDAANAPEEAFKQQMSAAMQKIYEVANVDAPAAAAAMQENLRRVQMHICAPVMYYGTSLYGLFSAQVVPNDEAVSANYGKKIFAFVDFIRAKAINQPKTVLNDYVFEPQLLEFNESIKADEKFFKQVYEYSTIGHEGGHMFFIDCDTEALMNASGVFKNIEEFKASAGGLYNFCMLPLRGAKKRALEQALLANVAMRAIRLLAYANEQEIEPYYTEALIFLALLKKSKAISFNLGEVSPKAPLISVDLSRFAAFKEVLLASYLELAKHYLNKLDAALFLEQYAVKRGDQFVSTSAQIAAVAKKYQELYKQYASVKKA